ncbi:mas-related G-protein coupled receptor member H-like [Egretta garzetta]|uniref:mas-related G-protein coupled receptor member H-like n=1 Tax=Egretta garzetta TaxID=188379 RepID=UPI00051EE56F|nr:mas-related G-protein coupled receptor member H-like [Egretta garzetta]XP_035753888.1 mas-related G-protein coupled receptor member H-like [Egretta garzetta]XP_035753889.1 mas-related G-protein coupled receptor member H-like [Egretta garzetta]
MELNQTVPPPTPLLPETDGDELCGMEVTGMAIDGVTLLICLCGLLGNGAVLWFLGVRIRRNPITVYILNLAVTDFIFLLLMGTSSLLYMIENASCSTVLSLRFLKALFLLSLFSYNMGLYLLTTISIERCVSILCASIHRPRHLSAVVCVLLWALSIAVIATVTSLCLLHEHEHCRMALIFMYVLNLFIFAPTMVISSIITFIKVLCGSQQHQPKRFYVAIFLTILFYLIFGLPLSIWNFLQQFDYPVISYQVVFLLACINSSIKPFIYFLVGSCRRHCSLVSLRVAFRRVFKEPEDNTACSNAIRMDPLAPAS